MNCASYVCMVHMVKLCVGAETIDDLVVWQKHVAKERRRLGLSPLVVHETRMMPKRADELLNGGSLYWVIKGVIQVRQEISAINQRQDRFGKSYCEIGLKRELVRTAPMGKKAFQGWRYLKETDAPADLTGADAKDVPPQLSAALRDAGVW